MRATPRQAKALQRWFGGLVVTLLAAACAPGEFGGESAGSRAGAGSEPVTLDREQAQTHRQLGLGLESAGDFTGAVAEYETALTLGPWPKADSGSIADDSPFNDLARICARREPAEAVVRACTRVIRSFSFQNEGLATFLANRGDAYVLLGQFDRARADYDTVLKVAPNDPRALFSRGKMLAKVGDHTAAVFDFGRVIPALPDPLEARYARARSLAELGLFEKAIADYDHILAGPDILTAQPDAYRDRARLHCLNGQADAAAIDWQVWLAAVPGGAEYVQDMLWARGYLRGRIGSDFSPAALDALRAWTNAGCPESG